MIECWVLVRDGKPGVFVYPTEAAARRVVSKGHTVVRLTDAEPEIESAVRQDLRDLQEAKAKYEDAMLERRRGL